jgi:hypothetical protein
MRTFSGFSSFNYNGAIQPRAINAFAARATGVPFLIDWGAIQAQIAGGSGIAGAPLDIAVTIAALASQGGQPPLQTCRSLYVDNTDNFFPVWVHFPDTGVSFAVPENSIRTFPALTGALTCQVCATLPTITTLISGGVEIVPTLVVMCDAPMPMQDGSPYPSTNEMLIGSGSSFVTQKVLNKAAGDQLLMGSVSLSIPGQTLSVPISTESEVVVINSLHIGLAGMKAAENWELDFVAGDYGTKTFAGLTPASITDIYTPILAINGAQIRITNTNNSGVKFQCNAVTTQGTAFITMGYTVMDNI